MTPDAPMAPARRRWLAAEVIQTSSMDCGPAALTCMLNGHGIAASYGRLREACQTSVDGTSIDRLEDVAQRLGLLAEQVLVPADHVALPGTPDAPSIAVVRHADQGAHFMVVWRRLGRWVQVMDPACGRQWISAQALQQRLYRHETVVEAEDWLAWARSDENRLAMGARMRALGLGGSACQALLDEADACGGWLPWAALDAATRSAAALVRAQGLRRGAEVLRLVQALVQQCLLNPAACRELLPPADWSVWAIAEGGVPPAQASRLHLRGAVILRVDGRADAPAQAAVAGELPQELSAALAERPESAWRTLWRLLQADPHRSPRMLLVAAACTAAAVALELLLLRAGLDLSAQLRGRGQREIAVIAGLGFLALRPIWDAAGLREVQRLGRQLDLRLRAALLTRLPRLHDRYFQSRPISDMADRAHGMQMVRDVPHTLLGLSQAVFDTLLTAAGLIWLAPASAPWALAMWAVAVALPLGSLPLLRERDLRVRTHAAALAGFNLDALQGWLPVRAHRAERAVRREHEALLVEWSRALRHWVRGALTIDALQGSLALGLALAFLAHHFRVQGAVAASDLLLVFWTLKLPALGRRVASLCEWLPAQRNALMRLLEPLHASVDTASEVGPEPVLPTLGPGPGWSVHIAQGVVRAGGHDILSGLNLAIAAGEQVAVVGVSGAGKSSLLGLLLGWHRLAAGTLHIQGRLCSGDQATQIDTLRPHMAWVDPAVQLWNRSLHENLMYACDDDAIARLDEVCRQTRVDAVSARLPQGLQTPLGEGGGLLSGGEGQRVRLGRALLQTSPGLVLLDEPFRGLDRPQRRALLDLARTGWPGSTLLCVTHDVGETLNFPRVLVIEDGRLLEDGAPQELATRDTRYRALLDAEDRLQARAWGAGGWRHLTLAEGRLTESGAQVPAPVPAPAPANANAA